MHIHGIASVISFIDAMLCKIDVWLSAAYVVGSNGFEPFEKRGGVSAVVQCKSHRPLRGER